MHDGALINVCHLQPLTDLSFLGECVCVLRTKKLTGQTALQMIETYPLCLLLALSGDLPLLKYHNNDLERMIINHFSKKSLSIFCPSHLAFNLHYHTTKKDEQGWLTVFNLITKQNWRICRFICISYRNEWKPRVAWIVVLLKKWI